MYFGILAGAQREAGSRHCLRQSESRKTHAQRIVPGDKRVSGAAHQADAQQSIHHMLCLFRLLPMHSVQNRSTIIPVHRENSMTNAR